MTAAPSGMQLTGSGLVGSSSAGDLLDPSMEEEDDEYEYEVIAADGEGVHEIDDD